MTKTFEVGVDGSISASGQNPRVAVRESRMPEILEALKAPKFSASKLTRLITEEIALLVNEMSACDEHDPNSTVRIRSCCAQIESLQVLEKRFQISEQNSDGLNFDGPEFAWAFKEILYALRLALDDANDPTKNGLLGGSVMAHFREVLKRREDHIRKQVALVRADNQPAKETWSDIIRSIR
jgi:hypothetical protein